MEAAISDAIGWRRSATGRANEMRSPRADATRASAPSFFFETSTSPARRVTAQTDHRNLLKSLNTAPVHPSRAPAARRHPGDHRRRERHTPRPRRDGTRADDVHPRGRHAACTPRAAPLGGAAASACFRRTRGPTPAPSPLHLGVEPSKSPTTLELRCRVPTEIPRPRTRSSLAQHVLLVPR